MTITGPEEHPLKKEGQSRPLQSKLLPIARKSKQIVYQLPSVSPKLNLHLISIFASGKPNGSKKTMPDLFNLSLK